MSVDHLVDSDGGEIAALLKAAGAGEHRAWETIVKRFSGMMWAITRSYRLDSGDALDVCQVVWLRLMQNLGRINEPAHLGAWLASVTRRECMRLLNKTTREREVLTTLGTPTATDDADVAHRLLIDERNAELWRAVSSLPSKCTRLLRIMMSDPPPSYEEIAAALDVPIGSIGPTRQRCLERLRLNARVLHLITGAEWGSSGDIA